MWLAIEERLGLIVGMEHNYILVVGHILHHSNYSSVLLIRSNTHHFHLEVKLNLHRVLLNKYEMIF